MRYSYFAVLALIVCAPIKAYANRALMEAIQASNNALYVSTITGSVFVQTAGTATVQGNAFSVGASTFVVAGGKVGVGVAAPSSVFEVDGSSPVVTIKDTATLGSGYRPRISLKDSNGTERANIGTSGSNNDLEIRNENGASGGISFGTQNSTVAYINFSGNFGIRTITPSTALSVQGVVTSSTSMGSISCNAGTGTLSSTATDQHGTFTAGTGAANCTYTFGTAWPKTPDCICADDSSIIAIKATASTLSVTCTAAVSMSGDNITYLCWGAP